MHRPDTIARSASDPDVRPALGHLKQKVNTLLWEYLPGSATLARMEEMAIAMTDQIEAEWDKYEDKASAAS